MRRNRRRCRGTTPTAGRDWRSGSIRTSRDVADPLPLWERVASRSEAGVRGLSPRIEIPHPSRTSSAPPSPTRGEGEEKSELVMPHPNDPKLRSFSPVDPASDFPIQNLPYGVFSSKDGLAPRVGVAIGDFVLDLWELEQDSRLDVGPLGVFSQPSLNA